MVEAENHSEHDLNMVKTEAQEREAFDAWYEDTYDDTPEWEPERNCYKEFAVHLGWKGFQAGRASKTTLLGNSQRPIE